MDDCLIVGGGVIGLTLAYDLAKHGYRVRVLERGRLGREASWAGAGILPPAGNRADMHPYDQLCWQSHRAHPHLAAELTEATGIETGFTPCGGVYVARSNGDGALLRGMVSSLRDEGIDVQPLDAAELAALEPAISTDAGIAMACQLPTESQLRNPWHLKALAAACLKFGVTIEEQTEVTSWKEKDGRVVGLETSQGMRTAGQYCLTAGAWTGQILQRHDLHTGILPVKGQMLQYQFEPGVIKRIINEGPRYVVPRADGLVLAGSTEEEVGFQKETTEPELADLHRFATSLIPRLADAEIVGRWAGLRPAVYDSFPYMAKLPDLANAFVAAGHFRSGLFLSPATAIVMSQLIRGEQPEIDLSPFRVR
jgi:glycine oxidase